MRATNIVFILIVVLVALFGLNYIRLSLQQASTVAPPGQVPSVESAPVRVYGLVEPMGREIYVGPLQSKRVTAVKVSEGDEIATNDVLVQLDDDVEQNSLQVAEANHQVEVARLALLKDDLRRKREMYAGKSISEFEVNQSELSVKLQKEVVNRAFAALELEKSRLAQLTLRSPADGVVYKMDVRVGELITPNDYSRIVIGDNQKQVRLFVEAFWRDRLAVNDKFTIRDGTTKDTVGTGTLVSLLPYMGERDFRTEDSLERTDIKYQQAIVAIETVTDVPVGLFVQAELVSDLDRDLSSR